MASGEPVDSSACKYVLSMVGCCAEVWCTRKFLIVVCLVSCVFLCLDSVMVGLWLMLIVCLVLWLSVIVCGCPASLFSWRWVNGEFMFRSISGLVVWVGVASVNGGVASGLDGLSRCFLLWGCSNIVLSQVTLLVCAEASLGKLSL